MRFFLLVFALSAGYWLAGATTAFELLPRLPLAALMFICPVTAALLLVYMESGTGGVTVLLRRAFDCRRIRRKAWYAPIILIMPGVTGLAYGLMRLMGLALPAPELALLSATSLLAVFFIGGLGEELGWSGYVTDPMQERWGAFRASLLLGCVWAAWHVIPLLQAQRRPGWIAWWCLGTVAMRVVMVWLYNNTGKSVFGVALFHATANLTWQLFPVHGSYYDPRFTGVIMALLATAITALWGPRTLARYRRPFLARR